MKLQELNLIDEFYDNVEGEIHNKKVLKLDMYKTGKDSKKEYLFNILIEKTEGLFSPEETGKF